MHFKALTIEGVFKGLDCVHTPTSYYISRMFQGVSGFICAPSFLPQDSLIQFY